MHDNPWNLSPTQCAVFRAYVEAGSFKGAAAVANMNEHTVQTHLYRAKIKMGIRSTVHALLAFDRWTRGAKVEA